MITFPGHIRDLAAAHQAELGLLRDSEVVHVTAALFRDPHGADRKYMDAAVNTVRLTVACGVPVIAMIDGKSHPDVAVEIRAAGAIVIVPPRPGLTGPYVDGALLASCVNRDINVVRGEIAKAIGEDPEFFVRVNEALGSNHFVIGHRDAHTWETMPRMLRYCERRISGVVAAALPDLPSNDMASGIFAFTGEGLEEYVGWDSEKDPNDWRWPIIVANRCVEIGLNLGLVDTRFSYQADENGIPERALYRLVQQPLMIGAILSLGGDQDVLLGLADQADVNAEIAELTAVVRAAERLGDSRDLAKLAELAERVGGVEVLQGLAIQR